MLVRFNSVSVRPVEKFCEKGTEALEGFDSPMGPLLLITPPGGADKAVAAAGVARVWLLIASTSIVLQRPYPQILCRQGANGGNRGFRSGHGRVIGNFHDQCRAP